MRGMALLVVAGLCAAVAGCGGSETTKTVTVPATETTAAEPKSKGISKASAERIAKASVLRLSDFPSGWKEEDDDSDDDSDDDTCPQITAAKEAVAGRASAPDFSDDGEQQASVAVYVYATESEAEKFFTELTSKEARACVSKQLSEGIAENVKKSGEASAGETKTSQVSTDPLGDEAATARTEVAIEGDIIDSSAVVDLALVRSGRGIALFFLGNAGDPFDSEVSSDLLVAVVQRLRDNLARAGS